MRFTPGVWTHVAFVMEQSAAGLRNRIYINGVPATPLSYTNGEKGGQEIQGLSQDYMLSTAWWDKSYVFVGLGRHQLAAQDAVVDDVKFFARALTPQEVLATMSLSEPTDNPKAVFTFEDAPAADGAFASTLAGFTLRAGRTEIKQGSGEGVGAPIVVSPEFSAGSPFVKGQSYSVHTVPAFRINNASISSQGGTDEQGQARFSYQSDGLYQATLTLSNPYGQDSRTYSVITIGNPASIGSHRAGRQVQIECRSGQVALQFAAAGEYDVQLFSLTGALLSAHRVAPRAGQHALIPVPQSGAYILKVSSQGTPLRTAKLLCK